MENCERLSEIATEFETAIEKFDYEFDRLKRLIELNHELTKHTVLSLPHLENLMPAKEVWHDAAPPAPTAAEQGDTAPDVGVRDVFL